MDSWFAFPCGTLKPRAFLTRPRLGGNSEPCTFPRLFTRGYCLLVVWLFTCLLSEGLFMTKKFTGY